MKASTKQPLELLIEAASSSIIDAARLYYQLGFAVLPAAGKVPTIAWRQFQSQKPSRQQIEMWQSRGLFQNIGIVCGAVSGGLVVVDLDGETAYHTFTESFERLSQSYTVRSGSGNGYHIYLYTKSPPASAVLKLPDDTNIELRSTGLQIIAPPSIHPETRQSYSIFRKEPIHRTHNLDVVIQWMDAQKPKMKQINQRREHQRKPKRKVDSNVPDSIKIAIVNSLRSRGFKQRGDWWNGSCLFRDHHHRNDRRPSFGFNSHSGYGYCFASKQSYLAKQICEALNIAYIA